MRAYDILLEFTIEKTAKLLGSKLFDRMSRDITAFHGSFNRALQTVNQDDPVDVRGEQFNKAALEEMSKFDPTKGKYSIWLINTYISGGIRRYEDMPRVHSALNDFNDLRQRGYFRRNPEDIKKSDINYFKTLSDLETFIDDVKSTGRSISNNERDKSIEEKLIANGEVEILLNTDKIKMAIPKTEEAASYYGRNTKWCTTSENGHMFNYYNNQGPLYIVLDKPKNKRWQLHFGTQQFMDERDNPISSFETNDFPVEIFDHIDFEDMPETTRIRMVSPSNEDGAGLPDHVLERCMDHMDKNILGLIAMSVMQQGQGWESYLNFLFGYFKKRFRIIPLKDQGITEFGNDLISFVIALHQNFSSLNLKETNQFIAFLRKTSMFSKSALIVLDRNFIALHILNTSIGFKDRFLVFGDLMGERSYNESEVKKELETLEQGHGFKSNYPIFKTAFRYMNRFIKPDED